MKGRHYWLPADTPSDRYAHIWEHGLDQDGLLAGIPATRGLLFLESYRAQPSRAVKGVLAEQTAWEQLRQASGRPLLAVNADFDLGKDRDPGALAAAPLQALETLEGDLEGGRLRAALAGAEGR